MSDDAAASPLEPSVDWPTALDPASAAALERLVRGLRSEATRVVLVGAPGAGKSAVLHALPQRLGRSFAAMHLPIPTLGLDEIRAWIDSFGGPLPADAGTTLEDLAYAYGRRGAGLVLMIDDANAMPIDVASALDALVQRTDRALRVVLAGLDDARLAAVLAAFGAPFARVEVEPDGEAESPRVATLPHVALAPLPRPVTPVRVERFGGLSVPDASVRPDAAPPADPGPPARTYDWRSRGVAVTAGFAFAAALGFAMGRWTVPAKPAPAVAVVASAESARADAVAVHINAKPWARVTVDGRDLGITPLGNVPLEPGPRRFRAELPDGRVIERTVDVGPETRRVTFP
jgi:AAA domain-containing protein